MWPAPRGAGHAISFMHRYPVITRKLRAGRHSLYLELWPNDGASVILFYPGSLLSPYQYRPLLSAIRAAGLAVAALHLTGHGRNNHLSLFTFSELLEDGLYAEHWLTDGGYGPVAVCGHSQGGILALAHAASSQTIAASFPISGVLPQTPEAIELTHFMALAAHRNAIIQGISILAGLFPWLPIPVQAYLSMHKILSGAKQPHTNRHRARMTYPLIFLKSLFCAAIQPQLHCSLCFFSALDDALFTPQITLKTFHRLQAPSRRLVWLPGGGHLAVMSPDLCHYVAHTISMICAGQGLPVRYTKNSNTPGDGHHGV